MSVAVVVSYVPLLGTEVEVRPDIGDDPKEILKLADRAQALATTDGVAWWVRDGEPAVAIVSSVARQLYDHIMWWSDGKPEEWFHVRIVEVGDKYALALVPQVEKSVERYEIQFQLSNGFPIPDDWRRQIIYYPLMSVAESSGAYSRVKSRLGKRVAVALMDTAEVRRAQGDPGWMDRVDVMEMGELEIRDSSPADEMLRAAVEGESGT